MGRLIQTTQTLAGLALGSLVTGCSLWVNSAPPALLGDLPVDAAVDLPLAESGEAAGGADSAAEPPTPDPQPDYFREAVNRAMSAVAIGQSAQSAEDWQLVVNRWQQAVALMGRVPPTHPDHAQAQAKVQEYQQNLAAAQQRAEGRPIPPATATPPPATPPAAAPAPSTPGLVAQIPIQERRGGTPVVNVTLQGQQGSQAFPMLFDTGATNTLITAEMAQAVGAVIVGETQAKIADGSIVTLPVAYIDGLEVGGLRKSGMRVAVGGSVGLLGQDVYGQYGIALGSHVINLH